MNELLKDEKKRYDESINEYEHLQDIERKTKLDTIDSELENKQIAAKVDAINKKPNISKDIVTHLIKLAQALAINEINHAKLDLQTRIGDTELENLLLTNQFNNNNNDDNEFNEGDKNIKDEALERVKEITNKKIELQKIINKIFIVEKKVIQDNNIKEKAE